MMKNFKNFSNTTINETSSVNESIDNNNNNTYKKYNNSNTYENYLNGNINNNNNNTNENTSLLRIDNETKIDDSIIDMELDVSISTKYNLNTLTCPSLAELATPADSLSFKGVLNKSMTKGSKAMRMLGSNIAQNDSKFFPLSKTSSLTRNLSSKRAAQKRLFFKNGNINISRCNIDKRRRRYLTDIFTTLIDLKWRYNVFVFGAGFFFSWTAFAVAWYFISYIHGDLLPENINKTISLRIPCIQGVESFAGAILFSIETQQTIGYGVRYTTEKCPEAILVMMIQSSVGVMIQSFMVGIVFAKLSRPKKRSETLMFSKNACISLRDGRLCLLCRVADMRKSHIVEAHVRMYLIRKKVTSEGEIIPLHMYDLNVGWDKGI
jgi:hypothetical protein